jgi:hypothetical protein
MCNVAKALTVTKRKVFSLRHKVFGPVKYKVSSFFRAQFVLNTEVLEHMRRDVAWV